MVSTTAPHPGQDRVEQDRVEEVWITAEELIIERIGSMTRWDAERLAAAHERQLPPVSLKALRACFMQAAINGDRDVYLETAFNRIKAAVARMSWADRRSVEAEARSAVQETSSAVVELAQHALVGTVLADVVERLPERRRQQLQLAEEKVGRPLPPVG